MPLSAEKVVPARTGATMHIVPYAVAVVHEVEIEEMVSFDEDDDAQEKVILTSVSLRGCWLIGENTSLRLDRSATKDALATLSGQIIVPWSGLAFSFLNRTQRERRVAVHVMAVEHVNADAYNKIKRAC
jgi:hypothetical protein